LADNFPEPDRPRGRIRINRRAWIAALALIAAIVPMALVYRGMQAGRVRRAALAVARGLETSGRGELAARHLRSYLTTNPDDIEVLAVQGRLLAEGVRGQADAMEASRVNAHLLQIQPEGPHAQPARRRLVDLYIRISDNLRASWHQRVMPEIVAQNLRYGAAEVVARALIGRGADDGPAHRLLAMTLEGQAMPGNDLALDGSIAEYRKALAGDPGDEVAAGRLANLLLTRKADRQGADAVMDGLLAAKPRSAPARLAAHRFYARNKIFDRAEAELRAATELDPASAEVRLAAAGDALRRGDTVAARKHLEAIPTANRDDLRVQVTKGLIDFGEEKPDEAIGAWQQGLMTTGGTDAELTWWLAYARLQLGQVAAARPLVAQYRRLEGDDSQALYRFLQAELDLRTGRPRRAIVSLEWARDRIGEVWLSRIELAMGRAYEALWDDAKALDAYRKASEADPAALAPRLAIARLSQGVDPASAADVIERGLVESPGEPALQQALAVARLRQQLRLPAAARDWSAFDRALADATASSPDSAALVMIRADRLAAADDLPGAARALAQARARSPRDVSILMALANALTRLGRPAEALAALEQGSAPGAVGDSDVTRIARADLMTALGRGRQARDLLARATTELPTAQRGKVWEALGRLRAAGGDPAGARRAFADWAKLAPDDPRPRLAMLDLALTGSDEAAARATVESLREIGGPDDLAYQLAKVQELIRTRDAVDGTSARPVDDEATRRDPRLEEARRLIEAILGDSPEIPAAHYLLGEVATRQGRDDEAVRSYRAAWDRGFEGALPKLVDRLTRLKRFDDLAELRSLGGAGRLARLSAVSSLQSGDLALAARFVAQASDNDKASPQDRRWQAQMLGAMGKPEEAERALLGAAEAAPTDPDGWLILIRAQSKGGRRTPDEIRSTVDRALASAKTDRPELFEARCRWVAVDPEGAIRAFEAALKARPDDPETLMARSQFWGDFGRPADAEADLRRVLQVHPERREAARQLAVKLAERANGAPKGWEEAWRLLGPEPKSEADERPEDRLARAVVLSRAADPARKAQAIERLERLLADLPGGTDAASAARSYLSRLLIESGRIARAAEVAGSAPSGLTTEFAALTIEALLRDRKWVEAAAQIDRLAAFAPGDPLEAGFRARLVRDRAKPGEAAADLERAFAGRPEGFATSSFGRQAIPMLLEMGPVGLDAAGRLADTMAAKEPASSWLKARVLVRKGQASEAIAAARAAIPEARPADLAEIGRAAMEAAASAPALIDEAASVIDEALARDPAGVNLLIFSAMLHHGRGHYTEEVAAYRAVLARSPSNPTALVNLAWALSEGLQRPEEALPVIETLIGTLGRVPNAVATRGVILIRLGRLDEAVAELTEAVRSSPSAVNQFHLALALHKAGRTAESRQALELAKRAGLDPKAAEPTDRAEIESMLKL